MSGRLGGDGPDDVDAAFARIVAGLEREGVGRDLAPEPRVRRDEAEGQPPRPEPEPAAPPEQAWRGFHADLEWSDDNADEHYEPPEPPPLPRLRPLTVVALALLGSGVLLLVLSAAADLAPRVTTPIALVALASGIGLLLLRVRRSPRHDTDDDGAQV